MARTWAEAVGLVARTRPLERAQSPYPAASGFACEHFWRPRGWTQKDPPSPAGRPRLMAGRRGRRPRVSYCKKTGPSRLPGPGGVDRQLQDYDDGNWSDDSVTFDVDEGVA